MKRRILAVILTLLALTIVAVPVSAGRWTEQVTGGGQAVAGDTYFSVTASAWKDGESNVSGQIQYSRDDLEFHATAMCFNTFDGTAVVAGPAWAQEGDVEDDAWAIIEIMEDGVGSGDWVRVRLKSQDVAESVCANGPSGSYPGMIYDGNFNIRTAE